MRFVLVHGLAHGPWCWQYVVRELRRSGHATAVVDLIPRSRSRKSGNPPSLTSMRDAIVEQLEPGDVVVAHSWGGVPATMAASSVDSVSAVLYLCAIVPEQGAPAIERTLNAAAATRRPEHGRVVGDDGWATYTSPEGAWRLFFNGCDPQLALWAYGRLTPVPPLDGEVVQLGPNRDNRSGYLLTTLDQVLEPYLQRAMAARLGVTPVEMTTGHSPFLSDPRRLAKQLSRSGATLLTG
jgi:pimeloyl-ACP methyl ester carboxylesterase